MKKIALVAMTSTALLAGPALAAEAKGPKSGSGKSGSSKRCAKTTKVGFQLRGSLANYDAESVSVTVTKANKHAKGWLAANPATFALTGVELKFEGVTDSDGNGVVDLGDVLPSDRVKVDGKLAQPKRGCTGDTALSVRRIKVVREVPEDPAPEPPAA